MNVIPPLIIDAARLTSSTVVETAPAAYAAGTTYALNDTASVAGAAGLITVYRSLQDPNIGHTPASSPTWWENIGETYQVYSAAVSYALADKVIDPTTHLVYESVQAANLNKPLVETADPPVWWLESGTTNKWSMFDLTRDTRTIVPNSLTVVITPGQRVNSLALRKVVAQSVHITITSGGVTVYDYTENFTIREVFDWSDYFFAEFEYRDSLVLFDLPPYGNAIITIVFTGGQVECGACVVGNFVYIGDAEFQAESDVLNFSTIERNFDGSINRLIQRRNVPQLNITLVVNKSRIKSVCAVRDLLNATPAVWATVTDHDDLWFESLLRLGIYTRFSINVARTDEAVINLEVEDI